MGGPGSGRHGGGRFAAGVPRTGNPKGKYAADRNPKAAEKPPLPIPEDTHIGAKQPIGNDLWHPVVKAWWKALGMSDTSRVYQEIDWTNAWLCADVMHSMYEYGFAAGLLKEWHTMVEKLHCPRLDLLQQQAENPDAVDEDEQEAAAAITDISARLRSV